jgi:lantibiotic modifying enzyme
MIGGLDPSTYLSVAETIARDVVADAVWHGDRCNWVGAMPEEGPGGQTRLTYRALGPDLYGGTSGVALFLAELAKATGDKDCRRTAMGAFRHAMSKAPGIPPSGAPGLYAGRPGVALALANGARVLEQPALEDAARLVVSDLPAPTAGGEPDLMSGHAGAIVGLLALRVVLDDAELLDMAIRRGDALLESATKSGPTMSWPSPSFRDDPGLTGWSHGAAGIAVALLELAVAADTQRYREAAEAALAYERELFDPGAGNWPDLRTSANTPTRESPSFATYWCHGAPGIALGRLRALELGADGSVREEAQSALTTTERWVADAVASGAMNYSLCHGVAGNAEILMEGSAMSPALAALAADAAAAGIDAYHLRGVPWPSGAHGGATPGLFLGLAGIGRFYLRLALPDLPSLLLVRPSNDPGAAHVGPIIPPRRSRS